MVILRRSVPYIGPCPRCGKPLEEPDVSNDRTCRACLLIVEAAEETIEEIET